MPGREQTGLRRLWRQLEASDATFYVYLAARLGGGNTPIVSCESTRDQDFINALKNIDNPHPASFRPILQSITDLINDNDDFPYVINLKNHGFLIMARSIGQRRLIVNDVEMIEREVGFEPVKK